MHKSPNARNGIRAFLDNPLDVVADAVSSEGVIIVVLAEMSLGGSSIPVESLAETLQMAFGAGGKHILLPMASVTDIPTVPGELFAKFQISSYTDLSMPYSRHLVWPNELA